MFTTQMTKLFLFSFSPSGFFFLRGPVKKKEAFGLLVLEARVEIMRFKVILVSAIAACFWQAGDAFVPHAPIFVRNFRRIEARAAWRGHDALHGLLMHVESEGVVPQSESAIPQFPQFPTRNSAWLKRKMLAGAALLTGKKETHFPNSTLMSEIAGELTLQDFAVSFSSPPPSRASDALAKDTGLPSRRTLTPDFSIKRQE